MYNLLCTLPGCASSQMMPEESSFSGSNFQYLQILSLHPFLLRQSQQMLPAKGGGHLGGIVNFLGLGSPKKWIISMFLNYRPFFWLFVGGLHCHLLLVRSLGDLLFFLSSVISPHAHSPSLMPSSSGISPCYLECSRCP